MLYPVPGNHDLLYDDRVKNRHTKIGTVNLYVKDEDENSKKLPSTLMVRSIERKVSAIILRQAYYAPFWLFVLPSCIGYKVFSRKIQDAALFCSFVGRILERHFLIADIIYHALCII